ncbi:hypothetical protein HYC85_000144 [Camellia sinensis]|uniref:C3H1-type domain-containing protein n=1 Tax=Camellia sinensis TaxID=4442 RepID=A0A7J7I2F3_CAMSI|nr:hypothetical protein HYC85_000144 [Camellia sinensis]
MSRSGRTCVSKWDQPRLFPGDTEYGIWLQNVGESVHNKESQSGRDCPELAGSTNPELYRVECNNEDEILEWYGEGCYMTKMSPGLDHWRQQKYSHFPRNGRGRSDRSRSRSPPHGFKRELGLDGSTAAQNCRDFVAGRCRRGDRCPYLHQDHRDHEDSCPEGGLAKRWESSHWRSGVSKYSTSDDGREYLQSAGRSNNLCSDFIKGRCRTGAYSKYAHNSVASDTGSLKDVFRGKENDRSGHGREHEPHRSSDIPCKFFTAGNCHKGTFCRFSHHGQTVNPYDRSRDDWRRRSKNLDTVEQPEEHLRWSDTTVPDNAKLLEWNEDRNGNVGAHEQGFPAYSRDDRWVRSFNIENRSYGHPINNGKAVDGNDREYLQPKAETAAAGTSGFESNGAENWYSDMELSSPWNYGQSSGHVVKEESCHISQTSHCLSLKETSSRSYEQDMTGEMLGQKHQDPAAMLPLISENVRFYSKPSSREEDAGYAFSLELRKETSDCAMSSIDQKFSADVLPGQSVDQNDRSSSAVIDPLSRFSAVGQNQQTFSLHAPRGESITNVQTQPLFQEDKSLSKPNAGEGNRPELSSEIPPAQNIVNRQQPSQFINFSALAQLYGDMKQRSHLGAVPNPTKLMGFVSSSLSNSAGPVRPIAAASSNPNLVIRSETQYNPLSDNIVLIKNHPDNPLAGLLPNPVEGIVGEKQEVPSRDLFSSLTGGPSGGDQYKVGKSEVELDRECHQLDQLNPVANCDGEGNNETTAEESKKAQGNGPLEKMNKDGRADEVKKNNDSKGIWVFKFALVEFVKEMLKPKWKEGQISKESHKTILKKVVDKVIGSIQGAYIPDSQEKIDNYLSSSKQKLTQLVEVRANTFCLCSRIILSVACYFDKNIFSL